MNDRDYEMLTYGILMGLLFGIAITIILISLVI